MKNDTYQITIRTAAEFASAMRGAGMNGSTTHLHYDGEKFREGSFDVQKWDDEDEARAAFALLSEGDDFAPGLEMVLERETDEYETEEILVKQLTSAKTTNTSMMNTHIEIIEDNAGGLTIQNTATKAVAHFGHKSEQAALAALKEILDGEDMSGWDLSDPECYITDEEYNKHASSGGYSTWDEAEIQEHLEAA